jgi:uncharacterized ion transporter superfamily protein YfcC
MIPIEIFYIYLYQKSINKKDEKSKTTTNNKHARND